MWYSSKHGVAHNGVLHGTHMYFVRRLSFLFRELERQTLQCRLVLLPCALVCGTSAGKCLAVNRRGVSKAGRPPLGGQDRVVPYSSSSPLIRFVLNSREVVTCPVDSKLHFWGVRNNVECKGQFVCEHNTCAL